MYVSVFDCTLIREKEVILVINIYQDLFNYMLDSFIQFNIINFCLHSSSVRLIFGKINSLYSIHPYS